MVTLVAAVAVIVLLDRFGGGRGPIDASVCERSTLTGTVTDVRDGGTVEVAGVPIRLQGVAAPEWDEPGGPEVTAALREAVAGRELRCELTGERIYDRCVGVCELDGADLGAAPDAAVLPHLSGQRRWPPAPRARRQPGQLPA